jgi:antitoxin component YwqK of YwqJK toxin-antitoxin module
MKKMLLVAGLIVLVTQLPAQRLLSLNESGLKEQTFENVFDERELNNLVEVKVPVKLVKKIPLTQNRDLSYFSASEGKRKAILFAQEEGDLIFMTQYRRNQLHGTWTGRYKTGVKLDSGNFVNNVPDGEWKSWYPNGILRSVRTYSASKYVAVNNEIGRRNEKIIFHSLSKIGMVHPAMYTHITSSNYSFISMPAATGHAYVPPFINCLHHGLYMNFHYNGVVKDSGYYKDGLRDGIWDEFYENGQLKASGYYYKGQKNSGWKYYTPQGKLSMLSEYHNGKLVHRKKYHE